MAEGFCDEGPAGSGKDAHELLCGLERYAFGKGNFEVGDLFKVGSERGEMVRVVPCPGRTSLVVIEEDPTESFHVVIYKPIVSPCHQPKEATVFEMRRLCGSPCEICARSIAPCILVPIILN